MGHSQYLLVSFTPENSLERSATTLEGLLDGTPDFDSIVLSMSAVIKALLPPELSNWRGTITVFIGCKECPFEMDFHNISLNDSTMYALGIYLQNGFNLPVDTETVSMLLAYSAVETLKEILEGDAPVYHVSV